MSDATPPRTGERASAEFWTSYDAPIERYVDDTTPPTGHEVYLKIYGRPLGGATRQRPRESDKDRIREKQGNRCLYCDQPIGGIALRSGAPVELRAAWDHFVPFVYAQRNSFDNWVLACHLCNAIKHGKMFETVVEAQQFINARRHERGIETIDPDLQRRILALDND